MKTKQATPDYHVRGNYPSRILDPMQDPEEMQEPCWIATLTGCAPIVIAVYGHGLSESDAEEVAGEIVPTGGDSWIITGPFES